MLILVVGLAATLLLGERRFAQQQAGRARRRIDAVVFASAVVVAVGSVWTASLLLAGEGVIPATPDALRVAGRPAVEAPGSSTDPRPVRAAATEVPFLLGRSFAWPAPLPGAAPFGLADLAVLGGTAMGIGGVLVDRRRHPARPTRIEQGAVALIATPSAPVVAQVAGWELRSASGVFVVDATGDGAIVVVGVGEVVATDGIARPVIVPEGHGTTVSSFGEIGPVVEIPQVELDRDPLIWSHGRPDQVRAAIEGDAPPAGRAARRTVSLAASAVAATLALLVVNASVLQVVHIPSGSMVPGLRPGDRVLVDKTGRAPTRGDIVVFERPPNDRTSPELLLAKRVVATGGQRVSIVDGALLVDDRPVGGGPTEATCDDTEWSVPEGALFVVGDAREASFDSRCFGPIAADLVVGRVRARAWPPSAAGRLGPRP